MLTKRVKRCQIKSAFIVFILAFIFVGTVEASPIVWDWSPAATGGTVTSDYWSNYNPGQHFADAVQFNYDVAVDGIDIYCSAQYGSVGQKVVVTIWGNSSSQPGNVLAQFFTSITQVDSDGAVSGNNRKHADFTAYIMDANTPYWIGMSGDYSLGSSLTQTGLMYVQGGDSRMAQFSSSDTFSVFTSQTIGDMAFRLYGNSTAVPGVPEPTTMLLLGLGLLGLAGVRRKIKK